MFVDEVRIHIKAGHGGDGSCSFRREKFVPRGGPDGGDGGHGGDVVFEASPRMTTLLDLRYQKHYEAEVGRQGGAANCSGRTGEDVVVALPVGTVIYDDQTNEMLADRSSTHCRQARLRKTPAPDRLIPSTHWAGASIPVIATISQFLAR